MRIEAGDVAAQHALEPALGLRAIEGIAHIAAGLPPLKQPRQQFAQLVLRRWTELRLTCPGSECNLRRAVEAVAPVPCADAGELKPVKKKSQLCTAAHTLLYRTMRPGRHKPHHLRNLPSEALARGVFGGRVDKMGF